MAAVADDYSDDEYVEQTLSSPEVVTKYRAASDIVQNALKGLLTKIEAGAKVFTLCQLGDTLIDTQCAQTYKSKKIDKGVAFPTCVSVNEVVCHFSPFSDSDAEIKAGDVVKVDMGAHIDGFIAVTAHTVVVPASGDAAAAGGEGSAPAEVDAEGKATGRLADVLMAASQAAQIAQRLIKPGNTNTQVTEAITKVADAYGVSAVQGVLMHQLKQFVIDGNKVILQRPDADNKVDECTFEEHEVYTVDVCMSTGDGKPTEGHERCTVFKRDAAAKYRLTMKASRWLLNQAQSKFESMPFALRQLGDEKQAKLGSRECIEHKLLDSYPVLTEKPGDVAVHFKFTLLLTKGGTLRVTGQLPDPASMASDKADKLPEDLKALLAEPEYQPKPRARGKRSRRGGKKKAEGASAGGAGGS